MVDKLHKNTRRNILADRDETEENIFHLVLIRAVAQGKVQIAGKHTGTQHKMRSQHIHIDRLLQEFLQLGVVGFDMNAVANFIEDSLVLREILGILTRMQFLAKALELFGTQSKSFVLLHMLQQIQQFTTLRALEAAETRRLYKAHILPAHSGSKTQYICRTVEVKEALLTAPIGTVDDKGSIQRKVLLASDMLILHHVHKMIEEIFPAVRQQGDDSVLLIGRQRAVACDALDNIAVDFFLVTSRNLLGSGQMFTVKCFAELRRVEIRLPLTECQVVKQVDNIQVDKVCFHRIVWEIRPDGRSLGDSLGVLHNQIVQSGPRFEEGSVRRIAESHKEVVRHRVAILNQLHVGGAYIPLLNDMFPFFCGCGRNDSAMMQKSNAVEILNSQHTNLLTKQKNPAPRRFSTRV